MSQIAKMEVLLAANIGQYQSGLGQAQRITFNFKNAIEKNAEESKGLFGKAFGSIGTMAARYLGPLAIGAFAGWGVKLAADAEKAQTAFATMLGSADKAKVLLGEISKFAASTPFESPELRTAAQSLLSFGVSASNVMNRLKTLGDVAAGSNSSIEDLALIYGKTLAKGKFELEQGNQLAEKGVPIYSQLAKNLGVSQSKIMEMITAGRVSAADVQKAFESMAGSGGIFENAMEKQSTTVWGLWSSLSDNFGLIATDIGQAIIEAFDFKEGLGSLIDFTGSIRTLVGEWKPVFIAFGDAVKAAFGYVISAVVEFAGIVRPLLQPVIDFITGIFGSSMTAFRDNMIGIFATLEWTANNWSKVFGLAFTEAQFMVLKFYNDIVNFFTSVIPAVFNNFGNATYTFFSNLASNIGTIFKEIWDFIKSGGSDAINIDWKPLIIDEIKQAFARELTDSEKALLDSIKTQKDSILTDMGQFVQNKIDAASQKATELSKDILGQATDTDQSGDDKKHKGEAKKTGAVEKGSKAAFEAIAEARKNDPALKEMAKQTKLQEETLKVNQEIAKNTNKKPAVAAL